METEILHFSSQQHIYSTLIFERNEFQIILNEIQQYKYYRYFDPVHFTPCMTYIDTFLPNIKLNPFNRYLINPELSYTAPEVVRNLQLSYHKELISKANCLLSQYQHQKISTCLLIIDDINSRLDFLNAINKSIISYEPINNLKHFNNLYNTASSSLLPDYKFPLMVEEKNILLDRLAFKKNNILIFEHKISNLIEIHDEFHARPLLELTSKI